MNILPFNLSPRHLWTTLILILMALCLYQLADNDAFIYHRPIVKVIAVNNSHTGNATHGKDLSVNFTQTLTAKYLNGPHKGQTIELVNNSSNAQVFNEYYDLNDQVFIKTGPNGQLQVDQLKRDRSLVFILAVFTVAMVVVGGMKGLRSVLGILLNLLIFGVLISVYLRGVSLYYLAPIALFIFVPVGILIVSGLNRKAYAAILSTIAASLIAVTIAALVIWISGSRGVHYEEMEFLTRSPVEIFMFGLLIGTLGAIMDVAISMASFVEELIQLDPQISRKQLFQSGFTVANDIVGTMANTLLLAAIAGTLPTLLLYLFNRFSLAYLLKINLSLELIRALTGSIGIVLSVPITLYISAYFLNHMQNAVAKEGN